MSVSDGTPVAVASHGFQILKLLSYLSFTKNLAIGVIAQKNARLMAGMAALPQEQLPENLNAVPKELAATAQSQVKDRTNAGETSCFAIAETPDCLAMLASMRIAAAQCSFAGSAATAAARSAVMPM